ncbi:f8fd7894-577d-4a50-8e26-3a47518a87da [Sclerotinia trifoliorum]|uniref:F8fd7894-577d-4a50-8e26-3a47518a87da n=1 Tax=Sclerotinia trifoliorum TaxID=28548 RepID=A0A8H2ZPX3_9HELO|nr:f8fd7894-577d-4a50-8e26-3a47518a87da [Sclerotinia trifoliorum]
MVDASAVEAFSNTAAPALRVELCMIWGPQLIGPVGATMDAVAVGGFRGATVDHEVAGEVAAEEVLLFCVRAFVPATKRAF